MKSHLQQKGAICRSQTIGHKKSVKRANSAKRKNVAKRLNEACCFVSQIMFASARVMSQTEIKNAFFVDGSRNTNRVNLILIISTSWFSS
jgi:hypothetical protein